MLYVVKLNPTALCQTFASAGINAHALPLQQSVRYNPPAQWPVVDAIIITSAQACVPAGSNAPTYCVGQTTANAARAAGYNVVYVGQGGVDVLCAQLPPAIKTLLYLRGTIVRYNITTLLPNVRCIAWVVYGLRLCAPHQPILPDASVAFWSVQGITAWRKLQLPSAMQRVLCISPVVAQAWGNDAHAPPPQKDHPIAQVFIDFITNTMAPCGL